jgi:hypothetical protein
LQALVLLNDTVYVEAAQALARRITREEPACQSARIRHAFRLCLGRDPSAREAKRLMKLVAAQRDLLKEDSSAVARLAGPGAIPENTDKPTLAAWVAVGRIVMNLDEFITRE